MRRLRVIVALGAVLGILGGLLTASPALAGRGHKWQFVPAAPFTLGTRFCGFKVGVTFPVNKEYSKLLKASDGSTLSLATGAFRVSYTNLATGKTVTENASGPGKITVLPDGSVVTAGKGHFALFLTPGDAKRFRLPTLSITAGPLTVAVDSAGNVTSVSLGGHVLTDVCAALS